MGTRVNLLRSSDSGASALISTKGRLAQIMDETLVFLRAFSAVSGGTFTDISAVLRRTDDAATTIMWPNATTLTTGEFYLGYQIAFYAADFNLGTLGVGGTYQWQYWNGSAWTNFTPSTDQTTGFTVANPGALPLANTVSWGALSGWVANAVNGVTCFWVRVTITVSPSTAPLGSWCSVQGWTVNGTGTNARTYRSMYGNGFYFFLNDNGPNGTPAGKEAWFRGYEAMAAAANTDTGTGPYPTAVQFTDGLVARKDTSADPGSVARTWIILADKKTFWMWVLTTDVANLYFEWNVGEITPFVSGDLYNGFVCGRTSENSALASSENIDRITAGISTAHTGHYMARPYTGVLGALQVGKHVDSAKMGGSAVLGAGSMQYPNGADGGIYLSPVWIHEVAAGTVRGVLRGVWCFCHPIANMQDGDTFPGSGDLAGKTFLVVKIIGNATTGLMVLETSDTWSA